MTLNMGVQCIQAQAQAHTASSLGQAGIGQRQVYYKKNVIYSILPFTSLDLCSVLRILHFIKI